MTEDNPKSWEQLAADFAEIVKQRYDPSLVWRDISDAKSDWRLAPDDPIQGPKIRALAELAGALLSASGEQLTWTNEQPYFDRWCWYVSMADENVKVDPPLSEEGIRSGSMPNFALRSYKIAICFATNEELAKLSQPPSIDAIPSVP